jgi:surface antigen
MRSWSQRSLLGALAVGLLLALTGAPRAQVMPFQGYFGRGMSPEDNRLLFESVARLNAAEPNKVGSSESWNNPQTKSSGTSTILRVFNSGGMVCHLVRHQIVVDGQAPGHNYRLTWCRTPTGEWKIKS